MLILSRKETQAIKVELNFDCLKDDFTSEQIEKLKKIFGVAWINIVEVYGKTVRLGLDAPDTMRLSRDARTPVTN